MLEERRFVTGFSEGEKEILAHLGAMRDQTETA